MLQPHGGITIRELYLPSLVIPSPNLNSQRAIADRFLQPDIKSLQIQLTGFLDKDTAPFCKELWNLCLSAQTSPQGVPKELLEAKKLELIQEKARTTNPELTRSRGNVLIGV